MKIGIIKERKNPPDNRVPLSPSVCASIISNGIEVVVEPSDDRCFKNNEYEIAGVPLSGDLSHCDVLMGVKEVPIANLVSGKTYFFFSHTIKEQPYNRKLLQNIMKKDIKMIDYEALTDSTGNRVIAFGKFAGMVGAHNGLWTYAQRTNTFEIPRMKDLSGYEEAKQVYNKIDFPPMKIVLTGSGRVSSGAAQVLTDMGIKKIEPRDFLKKEFSYPVFTQLDCKDYVKARNNTPFEKSEFYKFPNRFESIFLPYTKVADIMVNGIFYDKNAPAFFTKENMKSPDFNIKVIADVTCDIAPESSIPSTLYASTIADPVFGYNPKTEAEAPPYTDEVVDVMSIDNLPNELARDASEKFGNTFLNLVLNELKKGTDSRMIKDAMVTSNGQLTEKFKYLTDYVSEGMEAN